MTERGFTLIEVLVATAVFVIVLTFSGAILTGLLGANRTRETLSVAQATTQWFENVTHVWARQDDFGQTARLPAIPAVVGASWSAQLCTVDPTVTPVVPVCGAAVTSGLPAFAGGATTTTARVVQVNLTYNPAGRAAVPATMELAKR